MAQAAANTHPTMSHAPSPPRHDAEATARPEPDLRLALAIAGDDGEAWAADFRRELHGARVTVWPQVDAEANAAAVWKPEQAFIDAHPRLTTIFNLGAGVDALAQLRLPAAARLYRLEDAGMGAQMNEYVCHALLRHLRQFDCYDDDASNGGQWRVREPRRPAQFPVGVMGLGVLGAQIARSAAAFGFPVHGWSRSRAAIDGVHCHAGEAELDSFLSAVRVLVCALPLTPATENILNRQTLSRLRAPGYLINIARGGHLVDEDLIALIDEGQMAGACLDVFRTEPLPPGHPLRSRPGITITPHISAQTLHAQSLAQVVANLRALQGGGALSGLVDTGRGY